MQVVALFRAISSVPFNAFYFVPITYKITAFKFLGNALNGTEDIARNSATTCIRITTGPYFDYMFYDSTINDCHTSGKFDVS
jgi:hypothetical protein